MAMVGTVHLWGLVTHCVSWGPWPPRIRGGLGVQTPSYCSHQFYADTWQIQTSDSAFCKTSLKLKVKSSTCSTASYTRQTRGQKHLVQSRKWQMIGMSYWYCSALCGHSLLVLTNNWTRGL